MPALPPCPYASPADDDLTDVVTHLTPRATRNGTVPRDPNETEVRWLLEAGLRALGETVLAAPPDHADHCAYTNSNGIFDTLPLERVMTSYRDMCLEQGLDPGSANKARLIRRWSFAANYQLDLIAYLFRPATAEHRISALQATIDEAIGGSTIGELVDTFSASPALFPVDDPHYRLQRALSIMFPDSTTITEHRARLDTLETERWLTHHQHSSAAFGLELRTGSITDLTVLIRLAAEAPLLMGPPGSPRPLMADGSDLITFSTRAIIATMMGVPWDELATRRVDTTLAPAPAPAHVPTPAPRAEITLEPITEAELTHLAETAALATTPGAMDAIEDTFTPRAATATLPAGDGLQPA